MNDIAYTEHQHPGEDYLMPNFPKNEKIMCFFSPCLECRGRRTSLGSAAQLEAGPGRTSPGLQVWRALAEPSWYQPGEC